MTNRILAFLSLGIGLSIPALAGQAVVPEPSTIVLVGLGAAGLIVFRQIRKKK